MPEKDIRAALDKRKQATRDKSNGYFEEINLHEKSSGVKSSDSPSEVPVSSAISLQQIKQELDSIPSQVQTTLRIDEGIKRDIEGYLKEEAANLSTFSEAAWEILNDYSEIKAKVITLANSKAERRRSDGSRKKVLTELQRSISG